MGGWPKDVQRCLYYPHYKTAKSAHKIAASTRVFHVIVALKKPVLATLCGQKIKIRGDNRMWAVENL